MKHSLHTLFGLLTATFLTVSAQSKAAVINFTTDTATTLAGSFSFDIVNDSAGAGQTIAVFPYFHFDLIEGDGYSPGDATFFIEFPSATSLTISGRSLNSVTPSGLEDYDPTGEPLSYPDRSSSFLSPFDAATTIAYSYTNVGFSSPNILTGDFSYNVVPEPSSALLLGFGAITFAMRRKK